MTFIVDPRIPIYSELQWWQIRENATAVTMNISNLKGRPWRSRLFRMLILVRLGKLTNLRSILWNFSFASLLNNGKVKKKRCNFFCPADKDWQDSPLKRWEMFYLGIYVSRVFVFKFEILSLPCVSIYYLIFEAIIIIFYHNSIIPYDWN